MQARGDQSPGYSTKDLDYRPPTDAQSQAQSQSQSQSQPQPQSSHSQQPAFQFQFNNASLHAIDTTSPQALPTIDSPHAPIPTPLSAGLRLRTDVPTRLQYTYPILYNAVSADESYSQQTAPSTDIPVRSSSVRSTLSASHHGRGSLSPASVVSSPGIGPIVDITPLPSPTVSWSSPGLWRRWRENREMQDLISEPGDLSNSISSLQEPISHAHISPKKQAAQVDHISLIGRDAQIYNINASAHARNRSLSSSSYNAFQAPRSPNIVATDARYLLHGETLSPPGEHLHREEYLAVKRGLTLPVQKPLTPPRSTRDTDGSDLESAPPSPPALHKKFTFYEARSIRSGKMRRWREVGYLGGGAFSTVMLAVSHDIGIETSTKLSPDKHIQSSEDARLNPKSLVAVKICEHGPAGGADEKRVEISLERELDILKSIDHPSLAHLKAVSILDQRAYLILSYCPGGDLYHLASTKPNLLIPSLIQRIFTELISAVRHLHSQYIVHRDIKLENVLVNIKADAISTIIDWQSFSSPVITLTDLGLGRRIPQPPESPLLETRCGSEDYAAPEIILGQQYDGRSTDAWALGILLYALMENRLPFDELPNTRRGSHKVHRIARCDWTWIKWANDNKECDPIKGKAFEGAKMVVEGLLTKSRVRWGLDKVEETEWVSKGMVLERPLSRISDDDDDE